MGKAVVIGFANLYSMPYAKKYLVVLESQNIKYDMIFWDRENVNETADNYYVFKKKLDSSINVALKLKSFFEFKRFALKILRKNNYEKVIILYSLPAVLLKTYLKKHFKGNFVFVYTDYTFESNPIYKRWIKTIVDNASYTTITSKGFVRYLPKSDNILMSHNAASLEVQSHPKKPDDDKIIISYIGLLRQFSHIKKFVMKMANDKRFILNYYGNGFCEDELHALVKNQNIKNVFVYGKYNPEKKARLIGECDIINNCFANDVFQKHAMTNRFYDAIFHLKPQIANRDSYSQNVVEDNGLGIAIDLDDDNLSDTIYDWYKGLDNDKVSKNCKKYIAAVTNEETYLKQKLIKYLLK